MADSRDTPTRGEQSGHHEIGIALPSAILLTEAFHHSCPGGVEYDHVELGEYLLRLQQTLVRERCLGWGRLQSKITSPT